MFFGVSLGASKVFLGDEPEAGALLLGDPGAAASSSAMSLGAALFGAGGATQNHAAMNRPSLVPTARMPSPGGGISPGIPRTIPL